jgi:DNA-binding transcriptional ArsR family regulator
MAMKQRSPRPRDGIFSIESPTDTDERRLGRLLAAVADPVRLSILSIIRRPTSVRELCTALDMAQPRVSHHLAILRDAGLAEAEAVGRRRLYRWAPSPASGARRDLQELLGRWLGVTTAPDRTDPERAQGSASPPARGDDDAAPQTPAGPAGAELEDFLL